MRALWIDLEDRKVKLSRELHELSELSQWLTYRIVVNSGGTKSDKLPLNPQDSTNAKANDPATWGTYNKAVQYALKNGLIGDMSGIDFEFANRYAGMTLMMFFSLKER